MFWIYSASIKRKSFYQKGFGLIELMISISIMAVVSSIILAKQNGFNSAVLLRNQTYEIALQIREIQLNAVSAAGEAGDFRSVLGLHFNSNAGSNGSYSIFKDADSDGFYDAGEEFGVQGIIDNRFEIRDIRAGLNSPNQVSIIFVRPNFDARFFSASATELAVSSIEIDIALKGVSGTSTSALRTIEVTSSGQIGVQ